MNKKITIFIFTSLVLLTLLTPFWVFRDLLFPFITSKAFYMRILIELSLPFYVYLVLGNKSYRPNLRNPLNIAILAFWVFNVLAAIFGVNPLKSFWGNFERMGGVFYLSHLILYYFYIQLLAHIGQSLVRKFLVGVIALGGSMAIYGVLVKMHVFNFLPDPSLPRVSATLGNPIFFASFLILPMFLTLFYLVQEENRWIQGLLGFLAALELWCIFLSETRGAVVGLAIAIFVAAVCYVVLTQKRKIRMVGGGVLILFVLVVGLAFTQHSKFAPGTMLSRVFNLSDSNTSARLIQWKIALRGFQDHPVLGVGSENYSVISNQYYNPEIFKYDRSWFDKPHNYYLEILTTNGIFGFIAYAAMLVFVIVIIFIAWKRGLLTLTEFCLLLAGFIAYSVQNTFVFDTIPASLMFYVFLGFVSFLWYEEHVDLKEKKKIQTGMDPMFTLSAAGAMMLIMLYVVYGANIAGARVAKAVNYGYAYASVDPQKANQYFQDMKDMPFNFDPIESSGKYSDFAVDAAPTVYPKDPTLAMQILDDAIAFQESAIQRVSLDPTAYQRLSNLYLTKATLAQTEAPQEAQTAIDAALKLAPGRPELVMANARLRIAHNDIPGAIVIIQDLLKEIPEDSDAQMQLGLLYWYGGQTEASLNNANAALAAGYTPRRAAEIDWMGQAYEKLGRLDDAIKVYLQAVKLEPANEGDYWKLAQDYAKVGNKDQAVAIAQAIANFDASRKQEMQDFITVISK